MITGIGVVITEIGHRDHPRRLGHPAPGRWAGHSDAWAVGGASLPEREGMATERLTMRHLREILRQKWLLGRSHRDVARSLGLSSGAVGTTVLRARAAGLDWPQVQALADDALEARLCAGGRRSRVSGSGPSPTAPTSTPSGASPA